jgi:hypothetical protein
VINHSSLTFVSPQGIGTMKSVKVTIEGQQSNVVPTWNYNKPVLNSLTPGSGPTTGGTLVTATGNNFGPPGTLATVTVGGISATGVTVVNHTTLTFVTPPGAGLMQSVIITLAGQSNDPGPTFNYEAPQIINISPVNGPTTGGNTVVVTGNNFGPPGSSVQVSVDNVPALMVNYLSHQSLTFTVPPGSGLMNNVVVTVNGQPSNVVNYVYDPPTVALLNPNSGPHSGGTAVTVPGTNFGPPMTPITVTIDGNAVQNLVHVNHTSITFNTPPGMGADIPVVIIVDGQTVNPAPTFSYNEPLPEGVGIGTTAPHQSAALDITSSTRGILIPRLTTAEREAITTPANGLLVYDSTLNAFYFYNGTAWKKLVFE